MSERWRMKGTAPDFNWFVRRELRRFPAARLSVVLLIAWLGGCAFSKVEGGQSSLAWFHDVPSEVASPDSAKSADGGSVEAQTDAGAVGSRLRLNVSQAFEIRGGYQVFESYSIGPSEAVRALKPDERAAVLRDIADRPELSRHREALLAGHSEWSRRHYGQLTLLAIERLALALAVVLPIVGAVVAVRAGRLHRRHARGACLACGYDLRGIDADRCPECGVGVHWHMLRD